MSQSLMASCSRLLELIQWRLQMNYYGSAVRAVFLYEWIASIILFDSQTQSVQSLAHDPAWISEFKWSAQYTYCALLCCINSLGERLLVSNWRNRLLTTDWSALRVGTHSLIVQSINQGLWYFIFKNKSIYVPGSREDTMRIILCYTLIQFTPANTHY